MAVTNPGSPNLSSSYRDIIAQMEERANLELQRPTIAGAAAKVATRVDQEFTKRRDVATERETKRREFVQRMAGEGRMLVTPEIIDTMAKSSGLDKDTWEDYADLYAKPDELKSRGEQEKLAREFKDTKESAAARVNPKAASEKILSTKMGKLFPVKDSRSSTGYYYHEQQPGGASINTGNEAPPPSASRGSASLDPRKRADEIRKQFKSVVDKAEFTEKTDAYKGALNSLKNVSITNDKSLIYSLARSREGGGRLSNQDVEQAARSGNYGEEVKQGFNRVFSQNQELTDVQRENLVQAVIQNYKNAERGYGELEKQYNEVVDAEDPEVKTHKPLINYRQNVPELKTVRSKKTGKTTRALVYPDGKIEPLDK